MSTVILGASIFDNYYISQNVGRLIVVLVVAAIVLLVLRLLQKVKVLAKAAVVAVIVLSATGFMKLGEWQSYKEIDQAVISLNNGYIPVRGIQDLEFSGSSVRVTVGGRDYVITSKDVVSALRTWSKYSGVGDE